MAQDVSNAHGLKILSASTPDGLEKLILDFMRAHLEPNTWPVQSIQYQTAMQGRQGELRPIFTAMLVW